MIKGKHWPIPQDKLFDGARISLKNSGRLLKEAKHAFNNNQYSTSLSLATLALEELGKHMMIFDAITTKRAISEYIWKNEFENHGKKLLMIPKYLKKFSKSLTTQQAKTFVRMENLVKKLAVQKLEALYVDWDAKNGNWYYYDDKPKTEKLSNDKEALQLAEWAIDGYIRETNLGDLIFLPKKKILDLFDQRKIHAFCDSCGLVMINRPELLMHHHLYPDHKIGFHKS